jgi:hypothetical protein
MRSWVCHNIPSPGSSGRLGFGPARPIAGFRVEHSTPSARPFSGPTLEHPSLFMINPGSILNKNRSRLLTPTLCSPSQASLQCQPRSHHQSCWRVSESLRSPCRRFAGEDAEPVLTPKIASQDPPHRSRCIVKAPFALGPAHSRADTRVGGYRLRQRQRGA